jgi:predicted nucleic acid-binding protein
LNGYADTGFLMSLYGRDANSPRAVALTAKHKPIFFLTEFGELEFANAVERLLFSHREGSYWTLSEAQAVRNRFEQHVNAGVLQLRPIPSEAWQTAIRLSRYYTAKLGTRTLDVLHVAMGMSLQPDVFLTFDRRQWKLAKAVGLHVLPTRP